jgi:hypothetical protein
MPLSIQHRGALERVIDLAIGRIPNQVQLWRTTQAMREYHLKDPDEFIYGFTIGGIMDSILTMFLLTEHRIPTSEELDDAKAIVYRRIPEIRNAIFNVG